MGGFEEICKQQLKSPRRLAGHRGVSEAIPHHTRGMGGDLEPYSRLQEHRVVAASFGQLILDTELRIRADAVARAC